MCTRRISVHKIWGKISVWAIFCLFPPTLQRDVFAPCLLFTYFLSILFNSLVTLLARCMINIRSDIPTHIDSGLSIIQFSSSLSPPFILKTPFPQNVRKGLGLGDSVRIDGKGSLVDFSNFRKGSRGLLTVRLVRYYTIVTRVKIALSVISQTFGFSSNTISQTSKNIRNSSRSIFPRLSSPI